MNLNTYKETFKNEHGEQWWFDYIPENNMGILWGNDNLILGDKFYIFDGICPTLVLSNEEKDWLTSVWIKYSNNTIYLHNKVDVKSDKYATYLTNDICPICLEEKDYFEDHHCILASKGGSDDITNMLRICGSCHALITNGNLKECKPRYLASIFHQQMLYGIEFYKMKYWNNKRFDGKINVYKTYPHMRKVVNTYCEMDTKNKLSIDKQIKELSSYHYQYNRSIILDFISENKSKNKGVSIYETKNY